MMKPKKPHIRILTFQSNNPDKKWNFKGYCKLYLNLITQNIIIKFYEKGTESISASIESHNYLIKKNALFVFDLSYSLKFVLILRNSCLAQKVYEILTKDKVISGEDDQHEISQTKILPFLNDLPPKIKKILSVENNGKAEIENSIQGAQEKNSRKRRHSKMVSLDPGSTKPTPLRKKPQKYCKDKHKIINKPAYEIIENVFCGSSLQKLIVFASSKKENETSKLCYEYFLHKDIFCCEECLKMRLRKSAAICNFGKKNEYVELFNGKHECTPRPYNPKRFPPQKRIIKKPFYQIFEKNENCEEEEKLLIFVSLEKPQLCYTYFRQNKNDFRCEGCRKERIVRIAKLHKKETNAEFIELLSDEHVCQPTEFVEEKQQTKIIKKPNYQILGETNRGVRHLIIFDPTNMELCHEYKEDRDRFNCLGCQRHKKGRSAKIVNYGEANEYVKVINDQHVCDLRPYNPQKFAYKEETIIKKPGFFFEGPRRLFIFDRKNPELCYQYFMDSGYTYYRSDVKRYLCVQCLKIDNRVYAKIEIGNEEYLKIGPEEHLCKPKKYVPEKEIIIDSSKFKIISLKKGVKNILVFLDETKEFCYRFRYHHGYWTCAACAKLHQYLLLKLFEPENGENCYLSMKVDSKPHICEPEKYNEVEENEKIITVTKERFFLYETTEKRKDSKIRIIQFCDDEKNLCYDFRMSQAKIPYAFKCSKCATLQKQNGLKLCRNLDGSEYLQLHSTKHFCKPIKYSTIKGNIKRIIQDSRDLVPELCKFEIEKDEKSGAQTLIVFCSLDDRSLCYNMHWLKNAKHFQCLNCKMLNSQVTAKLDIDNNGEKIVIYGKKKHICEPLKYKEDENDDDEKNPKFTNFILFFRDDKNKVSKLIVFTDASKILCYQYSTYKSVDYYFCLACNPQKICIARIKQSKNGTEYIEFDGKEHICTPQIFDSSKYESTIIPSTQFEIFPNSNGKPNSTIMISSDESNFEEGYDFRQDYKTNNFTCNRCVHLGHRVILKLYQSTENDEMQLEQSNKFVHECMAKKYFLRGRLVYPQNYKLEKDSGGNQIITASHPNDKKVSVKFEYDKVLKVFYCTKCREKNRYLAAKICKRNTVEFLLLAFDHICFSLCNNNTKRDDDNFVE